MVGVRQGNNMAPVLFLFLMTAFTHTLKIVWKQQEIPIVTVMTAANNNLIDGQICSHTPAMFASKKLTAYDDPARIHALCKYVGQAKDRTSVETVRVKQ